MDWCTDAVRNPRRRQRDQAQVEERDRRDDVNGEIREVVSEGVGAPELVIDGERQIGQGPGGELVSMKHRLERGPEPADVGIVRNVLDVIHHELAAERTGKCEHRCERDDGGDGPGQSGWA